MTRKKQFILHIGGPKAGSSAIQRYLFFNRYLLKKEGLTYLDTDLGFDLEKAKSHNVVLKKILEISNKTNELNLSEHKKNDWTDVVFSSEGLCRIGDIAEFSKVFSYLKDIYDFKIVFYIRNQVEFLYSGWQQWGAPHELSFDEWVQSATQQNRANWNEVYKKWSKHFKKSNFIIKVYNTALFPNGDIVQDFVNVSGIPLIKGIKKNNANYSFSDLVVKVIQKVCFDEGYDFSKVILSLKKSPPDFLITKKDNLVLTNELKKQIIKHYMTGNNELFEEFNIPIDEVELFNSSNVGEFNPVRYDRFNELVSQLKNHLLESENKYDK